ncbi:MAG TPA: nucleoside phosphorylase [Salegentibacter sp.]|nr:nucleoside phosphorylase [Salegentibacter sp.]
MKIKASELILNENGSIYHLNLLPEHLAETIITVGDPNRVERVSRHFEKIEHKIEKREFHTHTGYYKGKRFSVVSTGIGPDNIDIVFNELDALVNIDFKTRSPKEKLTKLNIVRIGTSGSIQSEIPVDSFLISENSIGFDGVLHFYKSENIQNLDYAQAFMEHLNWFDRKASPYVVSADQELVEKLSSPGVFKGTTATNIGFYGPQGRVLRLALQDDSMNDKIASFFYKNSKITNMEMETAAMYGLAKLLGHRSLSMNAIIANRANGTFSKDPKKVVDELIVYTLDKLVE